MDKTQIYTILNDVFRDVFDDDAIVVGPSSTAADIEGWDSLNNVRLALAVEDRFDVHFSVPEIDRLKNVGQFVDLIKSKLPVEETPTGSQN